MENEASGCAYMAEPLQLLIGTGYGLEGDKIVMQKWPANLPRSYVCAKVVAINEC